MARSYRNKPAKFDDSPSRRKEFKTKANGRLRTRSKEMLNRLARNNNLDTLVLPEIREVSSVAEVLDRGCNYCACNLKYGKILRDTQDNPKVLRK